MAVDIDKKLYNEIKEYCKINNLRIGVFINEILKKGFYIEKYGMAPFSSLNKSEVKAEAKEIEPSLNTIQTSDDEKKIKEEDIILNVQEKNILPINKNKKRKLK